MRCDFRCGVVVPGVCVSITAIITISIIISSVISISPSSLLLLIVTLPRLPPTHLEDAFVAGLAGWLAEVKPNQSYLMCLEGSGRLWEAQSVVFYVSGSSKRR